LALGANILNMAVVGVMAAYLPFHLWGAGRWRRPAIFVAGAASVLASAVMALSELLISGVAMPNGILGVSLGLFVVSAVLEGAITLAVVQSLETIQPGFVRKPAAGRSFALGVVTLVAVMLAAVGVLFASASPDGIEKLGEDTGIASQARSYITTPLAGYEAAFVQSPSLAKAAAGLAGLVLIYVLCVTIGRAVARHRSV
jgi:cobalt/nickel transport system permease protein